MFRRANALEVDAIAWGWLRSILLDPEQLADGLTDYRERQEAEHKPIRARLEIVEELIAEQRKQLERLLDLYLSGDFAKEVLTDRRERIETSIGALDKERMGLVDHLVTNAMTEEQIADIQEFAASMAAGAEEAESDFNARRRIVEAAKVQGTVAYEDGKKILYLRCELGRPGRFIVNGKQGRSARTPRCHPGSPSPYRRGGALDPAVRLDAFDGVRVRAYRQPDNGRRPGQTTFDAGQKDAALSPARSGGNFVGVWAGRACSPLRDPASLGSSPRLLSSVIAL